MLFTGVLFSCLYCVQYVVGELRLDPLVDTKLGLIRGVRATDGGYSMFMGIPYATVDENNPFGLSSPYPKFNGTFEANYDGAICPQLETYNNTITGVIDCLHLNIYVPNTASFQNKLPVMVYIHGGYFQIGFAGRYQYGPKYLVKHDVILVTLNYRLGPYGFMCLDIPEVPGNQGLKDQILALKWIKANIDAFGGDSDKITIFGVSAGAHSIHFHLTYGDETLFKSAILQSGSMFSSTVISDPVKNAPQRISTYLGYSTESATEAISLLAVTDPKIIVKSVIDMNLEFKPCVEKYFDNGQPFIATTWINNIKPKVASKPIMIGFSELELFGSFTDPDINVYKSIFRSNLKLTFNFNDEYLNQMEELVREFYLDDEIKYKDTRKALINFHSDFTYIYPTHKSIRQFLQNKSGNIFYYMFSYVGKRNNVQIIANLTAESAIHSDEIGYLYDPAFYENKIPSINDQQMIDQMTTMWTNFAKYGNPTPAISKLLPVKWTPVSKECLYYLKIGSELTVEKRPAHNRMAFWDLFYMLNEKSQKGYVDIE